MYKLSICMMVKNEEQNLKRCLNSIKPLIENNITELIIVDTGSEDKTVDIAKEYTNNIYFHKWNNDFSSMRNISISYAKGEWILIIDADERLDNTEELIYLMNSKAIDDFNTILLKVKNLNNPKDEQDFSINVSPRIFRNDGEFKYEGAVHNQPIFKSPNLSVDICLTHFGYDTTDKNLMGKKFLRTSTLLKNELKKDPKNLYYKYQLGVTYDMHNDFKESLNEFRQCYEILKNKSKQTKLQYMYIICSYVRIGAKNRKYNEIINVAKEAIKLKEDYVDLYYLLAIAEKSVGNGEEATKYFLQYLEQIDKYKDSDISKDMSIIMYHLDDQSKMKAYSQISLYYLENKEYEKAYDYCNFIKDNNKKIGLMANILIPLNKYNELKEYYLEIVNSGFENNFLVNLEENINKLENDDKEKIYKEFSLIDDEYGLLNKMRISSDEQRKKLTEKLLNEADLNEVPLFFAEAFKNIIENKKLILSTFKNIETLKIRQIVKYLIDKYEEFENIFKEYLLQENIRASDIQGNRVYIAIATVGLADKYDKTKIINDEYYNIFKKYIENGVNFISQIYNFEKARIIYKNVNNEEDRFFILMYIVNDYINKDNKKIAIKYFGEALKTYKYMVDYLNEYKDEIFEVLDVQQIKESIRNLLDCGNIMEGKKLITMHQESIIDDSEFSSMKAIIEIMEGNHLEGNVILKNALENDPYNEELLLNMSYLMNTTEKYRQSVEYFSKAKLFNPKNNVKVNEIISNLKPIDNKNLKVIHGTIEIANQMCTMTRGLKKIGLEAKTLNYYPNYLGYKSDYTLNIGSFNNINEANIETKKLASKIIADNDVFHFHFGTSLTLDYSDIPLLKELGKKVVMQHHGSDIRMYSKAVALSQYVKVKNTNEDEIKKKLEFLSKYISNCIVGDHELKEYIKDYYPNINIVPISIDTSRFKLSLNDINKKMLIVHAPTSSEIKGSEHILNAMEDIKLKYPFVEFKLVQGLSHDEALKIYSEADLIIDQLLIGNYGVFAIECMAMGKPVICHISDFMKDKYPKELPIIPADPSNIKEKLDYIIRNRDMLKEIGINSRKYVEDYHDAVSNSEKLLNIYKNIKI